MEYYSAVKKNTFESVLMRWMKLEPIIQSEVSQKEKHQYSILMQITSPGWMHETSARGWCIRMTQRDGMGREVGVEFRMGNTCKSMADSYQCMAKTTTVL